MHFLILRQGPCVGFHIEPAVVLGWGSILYPRILFAVFYFPSLLGNILNISITFGNVNFFTIKAVYILHIMRSSLRDWVCALHWASLVFQPSSSSSPCPCPCLVFAVFWLPTFAEQYPYISITFRIVNLFTIKAAMRSKCIAIFLQPINCVLFFLPCKLSSTLAAGSTGQSTQ